MRNSLWIQRVGRCRWEWERGVESPKGIHRAILKYADRLPEIEPKHLGVYFRKILGDPIQQIADDLGVTTATAESWASGDREILCIIYDPAGQVTGSLEGAQR